MKTRFTIAFRLALASTIVLLPGVVASSQDLKVQRVGGDERVKVNSDLVSFTVSVTDWTGRAMPGLDKRAFTVFDDKIPQKDQFLR